MSSDEVQKILGTYGSKISAGLEAFFSDVPKLLKVDLSPHSAAALEKLQEYSLRPSKRIRGSLASFSYDYAAQTHYGQTGIQAGMALELIQNFLLIVDDVMDKSDLRRGQPTIHELYFKEEADPHLDRHFSNMLAINVGLISQHLSNLMMTSINEEPERIRQAILLLHRNVCITGFGQIDDLYQQVGQKIDEEDIIRKYRFKSSYYTFVNPLQIGLVLGGVSDQTTLDEVEKFGLAAGIAFQLHDDLLGIFGDSQKMGKSNLDDIKEGKYTLLIHHALTNADEQEAASLYQRLGNPKIIVKDLEVMQRILVKNGSKKFVENKVLYYAQAAKGFLKNNKLWDERAKETLEAIIDYSITREK